ncbi:MAG: 50S ribosomal protein L35ae [Euryarchaeota archaeon]|nr:50S ribosomal protein L35ae [Euryarchaeota archaeon]
MSTLQIATFSGRVGNKDNALAIIEVGAANREALLGTHVVWTDPSGKTIRGKIYKVHGTKSVMVRFARGLPGTAIGTMVESSTSKKNKK